MHVGHRRGIEYRVLARIRRSQSKAVLVPADFLDLLGTLWPSADAIAAAVARRDGLRLQPTGAYAANLLGLSAQVPAKVVFLTDGRSRVVTAGRVTVQLRKTPPRVMSLAGTSSGLVVQALKWIGRDRLTRAHVMCLKRALPARERRRLAEAFPVAPAWMHPALRELAGA